MALIKRSSKTASAETPSSTQGGSRPAGRAGGPAPTPVAKRRVGGVAVAVALAALGGVGAWAGSQANDATPHLVVNTAVERGQRIESSMLATVSVAGEPASLIPADEAQQVIGQLATTDLEPGSTITRTSTAGSLGVEPGEALVGLALEAGRLPSRDLAAGDRVVVVYTPSNKAGEDSGKPPAPIPGVVETHGRDEVSGKSTVDLRVSQDQAQQVAAWAAAGTASVVMQGEQK